MTSTTMTSMQRVLTTLGHQEPDRVPLFLLTTMHGAKELGMTIEHYFSSAEQVAQGQMRLLEKYRGDCVYPFFYASIETEAWGGTTNFVPDGPPTCGAPVITRPADIETLSSPKVENSPALQKVLTSIRLLKQQLIDTVPIIGVAISPFSLPVMQMGFHSYIELMYEQPALFDRLMQLNEEFTVSWANAQLEAGATAICYFDPVSSTTSIPRELYLLTGQQVAKRTISRIKGPTATHLASGRGLSILSDIADTGTAVVGVSGLEDLAELKTAAGGRVSLLGNLNGVEMRRWTPQQAEMEVKRAIAKAGQGGGFLLADNHGEIPWQVPESVLLAIRDAVERWGQYPLTWIDDWQD
ncbi:MAG: uroporphyrinogen decarboxylase family protein [Comamonadaceae bacterium]|nr:uroporphyrinogen decarboxylase family protein [Comamonadaceae bacterium]